jgi:transcriptional regulator with XRE-family HTH domain
MGTQRRPRPIFLPSKLRQIREHLDASQSQMATRICEYESGAREPNLIVLLHYAQAAKVWVEDLIDDEAELVFGTRKRRKAKSVKKSVSVSANPKYGFPCW